MLYVRTSGSVLTPYEDHYSSMAAAVTGVEVLNFACVVLFRLKKTCSMCVQMVFCGINGVSSLSVGCP